MGCGASRTGPRWGGGEGAESGHPRPGLEGSSVLSFVRLHLDQVGKWAVASVSRSWREEEETGVLTAGPLLHTDSQVATGVSLSPKATAEQFRVVGCFEKFTPHTQGKGNTPNVD